MAPQRLTPLTLALLAILSPLHAQESALPALNVTAKGYAAADADHPGSTLVVTRPSLDQRNAQHMGDALRGEPGIAIANDSAQGQNPVIRGLGKDSLVLLVDGVRFNSAQPAGAIASFMSVGMAERIEIVKGGGSVLYGTGAMSGVINVLLPQARFVPGLSVDASASYDSASQGTRGTAVAHASQGDHAIMLGASLARIDDYKAPNGTVARTGYDSDAVIGQYRFRIDPQQQLRVSAQWHRDQDVWYPGSTKGSNLANPYAAPTTTVHSPSQARHLLEVGYQRRGEGAQPLNLDIRAYRQEMARSIYAWNNSLNRDAVTTDVRFVTDGLDLKSDWLLHPAHLLSFGVNTWEMSGNPNRIMNGVSNTPFQNGHIRAVGVYLQDDMRFGALNLLAGVRYDRVSSSADSMGNGTRTSGLDNQDNAFSGSLGAIFELAPLLRPYVRYARAFRAPGMRERYESGLRGDGYFYAGSPEVKAETANQFELGLKGETSSLNYVLSAYHQRIENYLTGQILSGAAATAACGANAAFCKKNVNLGQATLHGVDAKIRWHAGGSHWLSAGYSRVRGQNDDLNEPLFQMPADEISLGWLGRLMPSLQADLTVRLVDRQTRIASRFTNGAENATSGFVTADLGATWQFAKDHSLRFAIKNLADKTYHEHLTEGLSGNEIKAPGRSVQLAWRGRF